MMTAIQAGAEAAQSPTHQPFGKLHDMFLSVCAHVHACVEVYLCFWHPLLPPDSHNSGDLISQMNIARCQKNWEM